MLTIIHGLNLIKAKNKNTTTTEIYCFLLAKRNEKHNRGVSLKNNKKEHFNAYSMKYFSPVSVKAISQFGGKGPNPSSS